MPSTLPVSREADTNDYLKIGTYGGGSSHFSDGGPGIYGFNWWFNSVAPNASGRRTWPDAPTDAYMSIGAGGYCSVMIPSEKLLMVASAANWGELAPGDPSSIMNQRIRLLMSAAGRPADSDCSEMPCVVSGEAKRWHGMTLSFTGPASSEHAAPNPFRDFRLTVRFTRGVRDVIVPGYYAADGRAGESGADSGDKWRARFMPDSEGVWAFHAELAQGADAAIRPDVETKIVGVSDGVFRVGPTDKPAPDARKLGLLQDVKGRYFVFQGTGTPYIKGGADSPENLLGYADFDATVPTHKYEPHARDWNPGDPTWRGGKGKNLIGALNYLGQKGVNCIYFLTMNVKGDGKDVWPWTGRDERFRFDVSKLDQWEVVFDHMDRLGMLLHVVHQEQENDQLLDGGELGAERRLYYRELIARFAHHPSLVWNLGEENTNTTSQLKSFARYVKKLDPYDHPIVVHTFPSQYEKVYGPLLGDPFFSGASLQVGKMENCAKVTAIWLARAEKAGRPWAAFLDEIGPARVGVVPDDVNPEHDDIRNHALWAPLMAGGSGSEWLFGVGYPHADTTCEDFRSRDRVWDLTRHAVRFFQTYLPVREMIAHRELISEKSAHCFAKPGAVYAVYLPNGGETSIRLEPGRYRVDWYDPRNGGELRRGGVDTVEGPGERPLGAPPGEPKQDWTILVRRIESPGK